MFAPAFRAFLNAYIVFDGNSSSPPWWAMFHGRDWRHGLVAESAGAAAKASSAATRIGRTSRRWSIDRG